MSETIVRPTITPEMITALDTVKDVRLSPDGRQVAYIHQKGEQPFGCSGDTLLLFHCDSEKLIHLTSSMMRPSEPRWSHRCFTLAYFLDCDKEKSIWLHSKDGETRFFLSVPTSARQLEWSPDGRWLSFLVDLPRSSDGEDKTILVADEQRTSRQLWIVDVETGKKQLMAEERFRMYAWAPNSRKIVGVVDVDGEEALKILTFDQQTSLLTKVHDTTISVAWSPDGKTIAWCGREHTPGSGQMMVIPVVSACRQSPQTIIPHFPGSIKWLDFLPNGRIVFAALNRFRVGLYSVAIDGTDLKECFSPDETSPGSLGSGSFSQFHVSFSADGTRFATTRSGPKEPANVVLGEWGKPLRQLTHYNPQVKEWMLGETEEISWTAHDGLRIDGILIKPPQFSPHQKYPLIVELHGGPRRSWWDTCYLVQSWAGLLAQQGYLVLLPNPRGSSGRGADFVRANQADLGGKDWTDVMAGVDHLIAKGIVDPLRLGIGGWSYGGYLTAWGITQTERFRAAVMGAAMVNWISWEGQTQMVGIWPATHWRDRLIPYHDPQRLMERSPIYYAKNVVTPTLILHGTHDQKVPCMQAEEFYRALKALGQKVCYVKYVGEGHGIQKRSHRIDLLKRIVQWFQRYL